MSLLHASAVYAGTSVIFSSSFWTEFAIGVHAESAQPFSPEQVHNAT
jgi:hypothetical protein